MARNKTTKKSETTPEENIIETDGRSNILSDLLNKISISVYGTSKSNDVDEINNRFNEIVQTQIDKITDNGENSLNSFLGKLYTSGKDESRRYSENIFDQLQMNSAGANPQDFFTEQYKNRMTKQAMAQDISELLIELNHAKSVMCNTINSADTTTGSISRRIEFENTTVSEPDKDWRPIIEAMEKKFDTKTMIKDFVTPDTMGYGEDYIITMPYHHLFNDFIRKYQQSPMRQGGISRFFEAADDCKEEVKPIRVYNLFEESAEDTSPTMSKNYHHDNNKNEFFLEEELDILGKTLEFETEELKSTAKSDLETLFSERITVASDEIPIPVLEDGFEAYKEFADEYITEDGSFMEAGRSSNKKNGTVMGTDEDVYMRKYGAGVEQDGLFPEKNESDLLTEKDIKDCYVKLVPPTRMIPVRMMGRILFYVYIQTSPATPLSTILAYNTQIKTKDPNNKMNALLDDIATRVVGKFDKAFVKDNIQFKDQIIAALEYYDISNTNIHFQVVSTEYVTRYVINADVDGNGHSMLEKSLFYANLYLSTLIFKLMSIFTNSNDRTVNYVRRSGIDKNLWNDVQDIIRRKAGRRIQLNDIFSYSNIINKTSAGSEEYIGMTKSGDKPIEQEVISGQDVQLDTPLMESLRRDFILATEVPSAIINFLNEADFAKSIETANTQMAAAVASYQISMNAGHTDWYRKLLRFSTNMPEEVINSVLFVLPEPKGSVNIANQELINNYQTLHDFLIKLFAGDNANEEDQERIKKFAISIAELYLPIDLEKVKDLWEKSAIVTAETKLNSNGSEDEDLQM